MSDMYIPENDITETKADGTQIQVAAKGVPIPMAEAQARGFVKEAQPQGPSETKTDEPVDEPQAEEQSAPTKAGRK